MHPRYFRIDSFVNVFVWAFTGLWLLATAMVARFSYFPDFGTLTTFERWGLPVMMLGGLTLLVRWSLSIWVSRVSFDREKQQVRIQRIYPGRREVENHRWQEIAAVGSRRHAIPRAIRTSSSIWSLPTAVR